MTDRPFWETKSLVEMSEAEWESLCDGCGQCCLSKLIEEDTEEILYTSVACRLFDADRCSCRDYANRSELVPDCVRLTPENVPTIAWLPQTCAYRLIAEGRPLYDWHPLVSGDPQSVHRAQVSIRDRVTAFEDEMESDEDYLDHLVDEDL